MRNNKVALYALGMVISMPAWASDKQDFEACDGRVHPGKQDDGMRGEASQSPYSFFGSTTVGKIESCTRALASSRLLPGQTVRRAHLLRARAAAELQAGNTAKALADIDLAVSAAPERADDRFYQRSMGVSLKLLRALALAQSGDVAGAVPLAQAAGAARPYALQVQNVAATVLQAARPIGSTAPSPWLPASRLSPNSATMALIKEMEVGNYAGVLVLAPSVEIVWPTKKLALVAVGASAPGGSDLVGSTIAALAIAYARAAKGNPTGARRDLAEVRAKVVAARPAAATDAPKNLAAMNQLIAASWSALDRYVDMRARQIEARSAVAEGRPSEAIAALVAAPMPRDAATVNLLGAIKAAVPPKDAAMVPDIAPFVVDLAAERKKALAGVVSDTLLAPETPRAVIDYSRSRPNILGALVGGALSMGTTLLGGIGRTDGFRTTANPDGTTKVEFIGNTPSAVLVQEMTLLRAAELTRAAGKPAFVIVARNDYTRQLTTSQYGREISRVNQGYKTELTIRYVEAGAEPARAIGAVEIIDALGPLYYEATRTG